MNTKFKKHQKVKLLRDPDREYIEYHEELEDEEKKPAIIAGMQGRINIILPNGQYHVQIEDKKGNIIAYCSVSEDDIEAV
ncbi:hypothetical protein J4217_01385 [Candidatus Pacearchaeota archaeon]|nr:hypothetical protein [Candidatus Pacearchaeota archaeon]